ncbi:hypothetical protein NN561_019706 [Cricetulus griseus]
MALVTVSRSPPASGHSSPVGPTDRVVRRRGWLQRRQSFAVLRGAVLGLQDGGDGNDSAEADSEPMEEPLCEKQPTEDQTDNGQEFQSPWKQVQRQHLHLMVELLRPQDDIRLAAQLEAARPPRLRYLLVVSTGECLSQETILLGVDFPDSRTLMASRVESWESLNLLSGPQERQPLWFTPCQWASGLTHALPPGDCLARTPSSKFGTNVAYLA